MKWFKFYGQDFLTDPKMKALTIYEKMCWIVLLCMANAEEKDGIVENLSLFNLLFTADIEFDSPFWYESFKVLDRFENLEMIKKEKTHEAGDSTKDLYRIEILNFKKRQDTNLTNAERQAKFRERQSDDVTKVTKPRYKSNARIDKNRKEKNINTNTNLPPANSEPNGLNLLRKKIHSLKTALILIAFLFFPFSVHAETIVVRYSIKTANVKSSVTRSVSGSNKTLTSQTLPSLTSAHPKREQSAGEVPTITPIPKFLTDEGARTREIVLAHLAKYYSGDELIAADNILKKEAGYRYDAVNPDSGACGMVQFLPCSKLKCPLTADGIICQAQAFVGYIIDHGYGSPSKAWEHHLQVNWY
jgi:hypothetical protein